MKSALDVRLIKIIDSAGDVFVNGPTSKTGSAFLVTWPFCLHSYHRCPMLRYECLRYANGHDLADILVGLIEIRAEKEFKITPLYAFSLLEVSGSITFLW